MGRRTYLGGGTILRFPPTATDAWRESGPYSAIGKANVKRVAPKKRVGVQKTITAMDASDARRLARRRAESRPPRKPAN
jgi:hypothetical protein